MISFQTIPDQVDPVLIGTVVAGVDGDVGAGGVNAVVAVLDMVDGGMANRRR